MEAVELQAAGAAADLSIWGLVSHADFVVKVVLLILILASFWCWAIIFDKSRQMRRLRDKAAEFEDSFWSGGSLEELYERIGGAPDHPLAMLFTVAMREWSLATTRGLPFTDMRSQSSLQQRIDRVMTVAFQREMEGLEHRLGFLATVGSTAPFIGLFGTVWGIMNSFQSIAMTKNTSLAVVAPGIAEALLATALGLIAAIPAVVAYNKLSNDLNRYAGRLETFAGEFSALLSRQMSERVA
jgi:biopolymer transport protein TolQ